MGIATIPSQARTTSSSAGLFLVLVFNAWSLLAMRWVAFYHPWCALYQIPKMTLNYSLT